MGIWDDDPAFKRLAEDKFMRLKRLSWQCSNLMCAECDGFIHYRFKKVKAEYIDAKTGKKHQEIEDFEWDTEFESVQLEGGATQNRYNTPEGSKCECHHCHGRPGYDKWKKRMQQKSQDAVPEFKLFRTRSSPYKQDELSPEEKENLK